MPFAITTKLLGWTTAGAAALALAAGASAGIQTHRLGNAQDDIAALNKSVTAEKDRADLAVTVANQRGRDLKARDETIKLQSDSIGLLAAASEQNRSIYLAGIARADVGARSNEARAAELIRVPVQVPDDRCEAARALIEEEMLNVR